MLARSGVMASQALGTALAALRAVRPDVIVSFGPPLVGPLMSAGVARRSGAKVVSVIYDVYPDIAIETGRLRNPFLIGAARAAERLVYRSSDRVVVLSEGLRRQMLRKGVPPQRLEVVPVWLDPDEIRPLSRDNAWRSENGIPLGKKVVLYAGTIGIVSGAATMIEVAERLRERNDVLFLFVGEGQVKDELTAKARARALTNVVFLPFQPRGRLPEVQATADLSVVTLAPGRGRTSVPSKVTGYLAAGRPVVASVDLDSDTAECVRRAGGIVTPAGDPGALAGGISMMLSDESLRQSSGEKARRVFEECFSMPAALAQFSRILEATAAEGRAQPPSRLSRAPALSPARTGARDECTDRTLRSGR
jgi:colanic acid biosynthesis glycosyl transferase WcaI